MAEEKRKNAEEPEEMSLTDRFMTAMFLPKEYAKLLCLSNGKLIQFLVLLLLLSAVIRYAIPALGTIAGMGGMKAILENKIPEFSLENGTFILDDEFEWIDETGGIYILVDTNEKEFEREDVPENMIEAIMISNTNLLFYNQIPGLGGIIQETKWKDMADITVNNEILSKNRLLLYAALLPLFLLLYIIEIIRYLVAGLAYAVVMLLLARTMMMDISFANIFKTAIYAQAIGEIVNAVMFCLNVPVLILAGSSFGMLVTVMLMNKALIYMSRQAMP